MLTRKDLYGYQHRAVEFVKNTPSCALFIDMGLGKTVSTLTASSDLMERFDTQHTLVVAPLRPARKVWRDEIHAWSHLSHLTISEVVGTPAQRLQALKRKADIHTINRENLPWLEALFIERMGTKYKQVRRWLWDTVVLDESHAFMDQGSQRWKSMKRLLQTGQVNRMVQLTATPAPRRYESLWAQAYLLDRGERLGAKESHFHERWFDTQVFDSYTKRTLKAGAAEEIQTALGDIVLTLLDNEDTPKPVDNFIRVEMPGPVYRKYKELERKTIAEFGGRKIKAANAGVLWGKLLQLANGAVYYDREGSWLHLHDEKITGLLETLEAIDGPAMIPYGFKHDKERLSAALEKFCGKGKRWRVLQSEKDEDEWNAGEIDYLLLHPASAGEGTNLHKGPCQDIVWFGLTPNAVHYQQTNGRLFGGHRRKGKDGKVHHLVCEGTIDEDAIELLADKGDVQDKMMRALQRLV